MELVLVSCALISLLYYSFKILNWVWFTPRKLEKCLRKEGFRGNSYKLFFGDMIEMGAMIKEANSKPMNFTNDIVPRVAPFHHKSLKTYGERCFLWFGTTPAVVILDPEVMREVMSKNHIFPKIPGPKFALQMGRGLSTYEADKWAKHRKLVNPAFHLDKLKYMVPSFHLSCADMLSKWEKIIVANEGSCEVDVWPYLKRMTSDVISRTVFGISIEEGRKIFNLQTEQAHLVTAAYRSLSIPGWRFLPTKLNRRMKETVKEVESTLHGIISKRLEAGECSSNDLLGVLLDSNNKEMNERGRKFGMSLKDVIEECKMFYFAGQETTATLLVWTMILLSKHKEWQVRARDEVFQVFGRGIPNYNELSSLKIISMIFHEVLRLYPPGAILGRVTQKESRVGEATLPAGVRLIVPPILVHHDPKMWGDDATEFKPERFSEGVVKATKGRPIYFPFGAGPRICIGQTFTAIEARMALAMILQHFSFDLSPSYSHAPHIFFTIHPQHGAPLILTKYLP